VQAGKARAYHDGVEVLSCASHVFLRSVLVVQTTDWLAARTLRRVFATLEPARLLEAPSREPGGSTVLYEHAGEQPLACLDVP